MQLVNFTDQELALIREALRIQKQRRENTTLAPSQEPEPMAPEVYIARVGTSIPALSQVPTGTADMDTPGSASLSLYRINSAGKTESIGITRTVYNLSPNAFTDEFTTSPPTRLQTSGFL
jgi:hypothetical protein